MSSSETKKCSPKKCSPKKGSPKKGSQKKGLTINQMRKYLENEIKNELKYEKEEHIKNLMLDLLSKRPDDSIRRTYYESVTTHLASGKKNKRKSKRRRKRKRTTRKKR